MEAELEHASFIDANLRGSILQGANLRNAVLLGANFNTSDLSFANLSNATLGGTVFVNTVLTSTEGLDTCVHFRPSVLDHRTLAKPGNLPIEFLRGCGLPEEIIRIVPILNSRYPSCFISYSSKDEDFAQRLYADLQNNGVRCWFAPEEMKGGQKLYHQINEAIRLHDKLLLILSEHSMNSTWVETEIRRARRERQEGRQLLFPIRLTSYEALQNWTLFDADEGRDLAAEVRAHFIPDFSNWKNHDDYQAAFNSLLRDLKDSA